MGVKSKLTNDIAAIWTGPCLKLTILPIQTQRAKYNITVNAIGPGLFETGMTENTLFKSEEFLRGYNALNPSSRPGRHGEVNGTILYLSSDASSYIEGQFIAIDGGGSIV